MGKNGWVAIHFEVTPDADLEVHPNLSYCSANVTSDQFSALILDGQVKLSGFGGGSHSWGPGKEIATVNVMGAKAQIGRTSESQLCGSGGSGYTGYPGYRASHDVTLVGLGMADSVSTSLWATWTRGVLSYDIRTGEGIALTRDDFSQGVHASTYSYFDLASGGVASRATVTRAGDTLGIFLPEAGSGPGTTQWECKSAGESCSAPGTSLGEVCIATVGTTDIEVSIPVDAHFGEGPYFALQLVPLGATGYITTPSCREP